MCFLPILLLPIRTSHITPMGTITYCERVGFAWPAFVVLLFVFDERLVP